jgi:hypothetical protein
VVPYRDRKGKKNLKFKFKLKKNYVGKGYEHCMHKKCPKEKVRIVPIKT